MSYSINVQSVEILKVEKIKSNPDFNNLVLAVEPHFVARPAGIPNDPRYSEQWYLENIFWLKAWNEIGPGESPVKISVLDSGISVKFDSTSGEWVVNHKALPRFGKVIAGKDFTNEDEGEGPSAINDSLGHGTAVFGVGAALVNNGIGIAGDYPFEALIHQVFFPIPLPVVVFLAQDPFR